MLRSELFYSPAGVIRITEDDSGLKELVFIEEAETVVPESYVTQTALQLKEYFEGGRREFDLRLSPDGTDFQQSVWKELMQIPYGETISYEVLSIRMKNPKAIRAIASANGANPIGIVIPCHRVIGKDGSLTGYAGGLHRKEYLLRMERGIAGKGQQSLF